MGVPRRLTMKPCSCKFKAGTEFQIDVESVLSALIKRPQILHSSPGLARQDYHEIVQEHVPCSRENTFERRAHVRRDGS